MTGNWPPWQQPSHSNEIEHRLTKAEHEIESSNESHEERHAALSEKHEALSKRLSLHEKAILALAGAVQIIAQDKYPAIAKLIRGILTP